MATHMGTGLGLTWLFCRDRVPITERKRFNYFSDVWVTKNVHKYNMGDALAYASVQASRILSVGITCVAPPCSPT